MKQSQPEPMVGNSLKRAFEQKREKADKLLSDNKVKEALEIYKEGIGILK